MTWALSLVGVNLQTKPKTLTLYKRHEAVIL